jgi:hypothetical protein
MINNNKCNKCNDNNDVVKLPIKKIRCNPIFRRTNYGLYGSYNENNIIAVYCYIENKFCGLCYISESLNIKKYYMHALIPLGVLNKIYNYKYNNKKYKYHKIKFEYKKYNCIKLNNDPEYEWKIDLHIINAETELGNNIKYCINFSRIGKSFCLINSILMFNNKYNKNKNNKNDKIM